MKNLDSFSPLIPSAQGPNEDAPNAGQAALPQLLPGLKNFADDEAVRRYCEEEVLPTMRAAVDSRAGLEEEWLEIQAMANLRHGSARRYFGRSDRFLPLYPHLRNIRIRALSTGLFPSDEYVDVADMSSPPTPPPPMPPMGAPPMAPPMMGAPAAPPGAPMPPAGPGMAMDPMAMGAMMGVGPSPMMPPPPLTDRAKAVRAYIQHEMENAKVPLRMKPFLAALEDYGLGVLKVWYSPRSHVPLAKRSQGRRLSMARMTQLLGGNGNADAMYLDCYEEGLRVEAVSPFNWYCWPMNISHIQQASHVFEFTTVSLSVALRRAKAEGWSNVEELESADGRSLPSFLTNKENLYSSQGLDTEGEDVPACARIIILTECWCSMVLPKEGYAAGEQVGEEVAARVIFANEVPVLVTRNPFFHQRAPYLAHSLNAEAGSFYGYSSGRIAKNLQALANDVSNQMNDIGSFVLNPIMLMNPALMAKKPPPLAPGVVFQALDVAAAVKFDRPPVELIQYALQWLTFLMSMLENVMGTPPVTQGKRGGDTATTTQVLQKNAMTPLQDTINEIEIAVMEELAWMTWILGQQYRDQDVFATIAGERIIIKPEDLAIDAKFNWLASNQAINRAQRSQLIAQMLQLAAPLQPLLAQVGKMLNVEHVLGKLWTEGFGFRGVDKLFINAPMLPPAPVAPDSSGEDVDRVRSTVEQAGGEPGEMAPGEGEEFAEVRAGADQLSAMEGQRNMIADVPFVGEPAEM